MNRQCFALLALLVSLASVVATIAAQQAPGPEFQPVDDSPGLPRVLLIGDSISIGYTLPVREMLAGKANVHRIPVNGGPTRNGVENMDAWLGSGRWDVIHFNFGLHDLRIMDDGHHQVEVKAYAKNLEAMVIRLKKTGARLVWASTTPVAEGDVSPLRRPADVAVYNKAAARVMKKHDVAINDLYAFAKPRLADLQRPVNVHFTEAGSKMLAHEVAVAIGEALAARR